MANKPPPIAVKLRDHLSRVSDTDARAFVEEAVRGFECGLYRSAVVMSWVGAVYVLYAHVVNYKLAEFNAEATKRFSNSKMPWKSASSIDDMALMKESDLLEVLQTISVLGKSVKNQLKHALDRRNACGHPNSYKLSESVVSAHVEELLLNVYEKFSAIRPRKASRPFEGGV